MVGPVASLLDSDEAGRLQALATLRKDPQAAREALLNALQAEPPPPQRWRLVHALNEFGRPEDVAVLVPLLASAQDARERRVLEGTIRALYALGSIGPAPGEDLSQTIQDFSFIQTQAPRPVDDPRSGKWLLSRWSIQSYHRADLPLAVIEAVQPLRGTPFDSQEALSQAIEKRLKRAVWKRHKEALLASLDFVPQRVRLEGTVRTQLSNPLSRPLLLEVRVDAWFGRFQNPPRAQWVYLPPGARQTVDMPAELISDRADHDIRLDLRLRETSGQLIPNFHKLYLLTQPPAPLP